MLESKLSGWKEKKSWMWSCKVRFIRSTRRSRPNKVGLKCPSVRPSTKSFFDFNEIWYV